MIIELWMFLLTVNKIIAGILYNQPIFCSNVLWQSNGSTFADQNIIGLRPFDIFITKNNSVYVPNQSTKHIIVWSDVNLTPTRNISSSSIELRNVFVTEDNSVYSGFEENSTCGIRKNTLMNDISVVKLCTQCYDIFIDIYNNIYCSLPSESQVIRKSLNNESDLIQVVAGIGVAGSNSNMLNRPNGIFVDNNLDLYVADHTNDRIQLFPQGQIDGITVVGNESLYPTIILNRPTCIVLDGNKYLFIVDFRSHRIIGSGPYGFKCIVGCHGRSSAADQLNYPRSLSFDSSGNIFVVEQDNHRIQKFLLMSNSCNETITSTLSTVLKSTMNRSNLSVTNAPNDNSYNQPKLDPLTIWNPNGITLADNSLLGSTPYAIFVDKSNTIYVPGRQNRRIFIWKNDSIMPIVITHINVSEVSCIFLANNHDIYTFYGKSTRQINKWQLNTNDSTIVTDVDGTSYGIFVDINNTLYISLRDRHKVITQSLNGISNILSIIAGTGCNGSASNMLDRPHGIFVDINFDLYVADSGNNRIQLFRAQNLNAITVAGSGSKGDIITLNYPSAVILDADKYLFIVDYKNNRIVRSSPYGFQCIIGCTGLANSASNTLHRPTTMAFDSHGNIYVVEQDGHRMQKFLRLNNTLVPSYNQPKLCPNTIWSTKGTTFANSSILGTRPHALFINSKNTIYTTNRESGHIHVWHNESMYPVATLYNTLSDRKSIFVTANDDIYVDNGLQHNQVDRFTSNSNNSISVMSIPKSCYGLFVDVSNTLYCSHGLSHEVLKKWLGDNSNILTRVAGTGLNGSELNMLYLPNGIFVDTNFDLYVADSGNNRIMLFSLGKIFGKIAAGKYSIQPTIELNCPLQIILDGNRYLYITERNSHRIIGSGPYGFRCIVACTGISDSSADTLSFPRSIAFDSFGSLFVIDEFNHRIQKFTIMSPLCEICDIPNVTLIPSGSTAINPLKFFRSQEFTIISIIELNCNKSLSFSFQWTIKNCSTSCLNQTIRTTFTELYIPARTLAYGFYEIEFQLTVIGLSKSVYIQIISSDIQVNLIQFGTSMITIGREQDLKLDPGIYSIDPDENKFDSSNWIYQYSCQDYDLQNNSFNSSLIIPAGSLQSNRTYRFQVQINSSRGHFSNYLLVNVQHTYSPMITIHSRLSNLHYHRINPTTQLALISTCHGNCTMVQNITWTIFSDGINFLSNQTNTFQNQFVAYKQLFTTNRHVKLWQFQVVYSFPFGQSISSMNFLVNQPPQNGSCLISPHNGTSSTIFTISCLNWFDEDDIIDYSVLIENSHMKSMIAFSSVPLFQIRLPARNDSLHLIIRIRDRFNSITEYVMRSVHVQSDFQMTNESIVRHLTIGNQNTIGQIIYSLSNTSNREYFMPFLTNIPITTLNSITFQSSVIVQLTTLSFAVQKCSQLAFALHSMSTRITYEDIHLAATQLIQCTSNTNNQLQTEIETRSMLSQIDEIILKLTAALNIHLNLEQQLFLQTSDVFMSLEKQFTRSLANKQIANVSIHLPSTFQINTNLDSIVLLRSIIQPVTPYINHSATVSFSILDENHNSLSIQTDDTQPIEIIIPRDPNLIIPPMIIYNVTSTNSTADIFHLHSINITQSHSISVHFELQVYKRNLAYLFTYKFDNHIQFDGWTVFCPENLTDENIYYYYLDNQRTFEHHLLTFGIRELNSIEYEDFCLNSIRTINPSHIHKKVIFTLNYALRIYASACFYLDENYQWNSDGLRVGPLTNHFQTQCFSTHS